MLSANGSSTAALVIQTRLGSQFPVVQGQGMKPGVRLILAWLLLLLLALTAFVNTRRRGWAAAVPRLAVVLLLCVLIQGCARLGRGTPPGTYSITVTGTSGNTSHTTQVTLLVR